MTTALHRLLPAGPDLDLSAEDADARLAEAYSPAPGLRLNLVAGIGGAANDGSGISDGLSDPVDRRILGLLRTLADVVLVGAASVRSEGYRMPRTAALAVLTASGDLSGHRLTGAAAGRLLVLTTATGAEPARRQLPDAAVVVLPDEEGRVPLERALAALRERGLERVLCEGGPALAGALLERDLVDELCLTTSPTAGGAALPVLGTSAPPRAMRLEGLLSDERSALYARWRRAR